MQILADRKEITQRLNAAVEYYLDPFHDPRVYWAKEVSFDAMTSHKIRVDYMLFEPENTDISGLEHGVFKCFEVKSSVEDFRSEHGHNFIGDYNYYVMLPEVHEKVQDEIDWYTGVLVPRGDGLASVRNARKRRRTRSLAEMLFAMWRSSRRDLVKVQGGDF